MRRSLGHKFAALVSGVAALGILKPVTLYKKGASGKHYPYVLDPNILHSPEGYDCVVTQKAEKEADSLKMIQKLKMSAVMFPTNAPLQRVLKERTLSWLDLSPEEKREVMEFEEQAPLMTGMTPPGAAPALLSPPT